MTFDGKVVSKQDSGQPEEHRGHTSPDFTLHFADTQPHPIQLEYTHQSPIFGGGRFAGVEAADRAAAG